MAKGFSVGELIKFGWNATRAHLGFLIAVMFVIWGVHVAQYLIQNYLEDMSGGWALLTGILGFFIQMFLTLGLVRIGLKLADQRTPSFIDLISNISSLFKFILASILYSLILVVGFLLLVFPMVVWGIRYGLFAYFIVDRGAGPIEALRLSSKTTEGAKWDLLGLILVFLVVNFLGLVCLLLGLFVTVPVTLTAQALAYRYLVKQTEAIQVSRPPESSRKD